MKTALSEALPVHDGRAALIMLAFGDSHLLEGTQGGQSGTSTPYAVLMRRRDHPLHTRRRQGSQLLGHARTDALEYVGATRQHNLGVEVLSDVHAALRDGLESRVMDATGLLSYEAGPEQYLRAAKTLGTLRDVALRQPVRLLLVAALINELLVTVEVECAVAELLPDVTDNLALRGGDGAATLAESSSARSDTHGCREKARGTVLAVTFEREGGIRFAHHGTGRGLTSPAPPS